MLAVAAAVLATALAGGAAVWLATSGDDDPPERTTSVATEPEGSSEAIITEEEVPADGDAEPQGGAAEPQGDPKATETTPRATRKTRLPRDRAKARAQATPDRFAVPPAREFSGDGNARLGTVDLRTSAVVKWSTSGRFELRFGREAFPIIAPSPSGQLVVPPYSFDDVRVLADGRWKITITPQR
jgi:hypothetical protein